MDILVGETVGNIKITVYQTPDGKKFFQIQTDNENISHILDIIADILSKY